MSELGLMPFAKVALEVSQQVIEPYSHKFSPKKFTQCQLLAVLCLIRYEDWNFRAAEVRIAEHRDLRETLELEQTPDHTTLFRFFERLDEEIIATALGEVLQRMKLEKSKGRTIAIDGAGLSSGSASTFFVRRTQHHGGSSLPWRYWLKWLLCVDVDSQLLLAQQARQGPTNDCAHLRTIVDEACEHVTVATVLADAEFDSERNHLYVRNKHQANCVSPAKRGKKLGTSRAIAKRCERAFLRKPMPNVIWLNRSSAESNANSPVKLREDS